MLSLNNEVLVPESITTIDCGTSACTGTQNVESTSTTLKNILLFVKPAT